MVNAYLNHDRWILECPRCAWAMQGSPDQFRKLSRFKCGVLPSGVKLGGCGYKDEIGVPAVNTVAAIGRLMRLRPDPTTRNWMPSESVEDLRRENTERGIREAS